MKELMLGNKAFARGLYEAGVEVVSSYPGTPSTEVTEEAAKYDEIYKNDLPSIFVNRNFSSFDDETMTIDKITYSTFSIDTSPYFSLENQLHRQLVCKIYYLNNKAKK